MDLERRSFKSGRATLLLVAAVVLLMLGNEVPLWELMLGCIKIGAVMIPATALLSRDDLIDRFARGKVRAVVTGPANAPKFDGLDAHAPGPVIRIAVGGQAPGWHDYADVDHASEVYRPTQPTDPGIPSPPTETPDFPTGEPSVPPDPTTGGTLGGTDGGTADGGTSDGGTTGGPGGGTTGDPGGESWGGTSNGYSGGQSTGEAGAGQEEG